MYLLFRFFVLGPKTNGTRRLPIHFAAMEAAIFLLRLGVSVSFTYLSSFFKCLAGDSSTIDGN